MLPPWRIGTNHSARGPATSRSPTSREDGNEASLRLRRGSRACCCRRGADGRRQNRRRKCNNPHGLADDRRTGARLGRCGRSANRAFEASHPDVNVKVEIQTWGEHLTKLDAALAGGRAPDVVELGNTETTKYMAAGALANLTASKARFPNNATWLNALKGSCTYQSRLYCVPYYAGARAVIYRKDHYGAVGMRKAPASLDAFIAAGKKVMARHKSDRNYSALYFPGKYWYAGMSFVYDYGGAIARFKKRQMGRNPQLSPGNRRADEAQVHGARALAGEQDRHRGQPVDRLLAGPRRRGHRERLGVGPDLRPEDRRSCPRTGARRVPDAEPQQGQVHADVPRRLGSRDPGLEQQPCTGDRLDPRLHGDPRRCVS